jgi:hypothetical protein
MGLICILMPLFLMETASSCNHVGDLMFPPIPFLAELREEVLKHSLKRMIDDDERYTERARAGTFRPDLVSVSKDMLIYC